MILNKYKINNYFQAQEWSEAAVTKFDDLTSEKALRMTLHEVDGKIYYFLYLSNMVFF